MKITHEIKDYRGTKVSIEIEYVVPSTDPGAARALFKRAWEEVLAMLPHDTVVT